MQEVPQKKKNCYLHMGIQFKLNTTYISMHICATGSFYAKALTVQLSKEMSESSNYQRKH